MFLVLSVLLDHPLLHLFGSSAMLPQISPAPGEPLSNLEPLGE